MSLSLRINSIMMRFLLTLDPLHAVPKYFRQTKLKSFQRQLNLWGFERVRKGVEKDAICHNYFVRGAPDLCNFMKRVKIKGTKDTIANIMTTALCKHYDDGTDPADAHFFATAQMQPPTSLLNDHTSESSPRSSSPRPPQGSSSVASFLARATHPTAFPMMDRYAGGGPPFLSRRDIEMDQLLYGARAASAPAAYNLFGSSTFPREDSLLGPASFLNGRLMSMPALGSQRLEDLEAALKDTRQRLEVLTQIQHESGFRF